jgi:hypothetical protein
VVRTHTHDQAKDYERGNYRVKKVTKLKLPLLCRSKQRRKLNSRQNPPHVPGGAESVNCLSRGGLPAELPVIHV